MVFIYLALSILGIYVGFYITKKHNNYNKKKLIYDKLMWERNKELMGINNE